ncbi:VanZ family protein [Thermoanaerobacterium sp. RBIITD]|uniref:VanZ family protein n=1 Tax=Thermoanaerobacterium sp. RBIITD TaxID=1550240 RepID=UPI000BB7956F|nr:VanZ family protein [Thermoanaerobacterium sp. RBIITD]SNX52613.1 Glycopeptide antibiotics resistance protein [Thermoanaerobacterium sp. RBIITD]
MGLGIMIDIKTIMPVIVLIYGWLIFYMWRKKQRSIGYILCLSIFFIYLLSVAHYTLFPIRLFQHNDLIKDGVDWKNGLNFIPFRELTYFYLNSVQGWGNVLITIPFGFVLPFISNVDLKSVIWKGFLFSISIELLQFLENIFYLSGYVARRVDINDVILNALGVLLGYCLFCILSWLYIKSIPPNEKVKGVWDHIHKVLIRENSRSI